MENKFISNVIKLLSGNLIVQVIAFLALPILTRLYTPEMYGISALFISITTVLGLLACLRYEYAVILPKFDFEAKYILYICIISTTLFSVFINFICYFYKDLIFDLFSLNQNLKDYMFLIPISVLFAGLYNGFKFWNFRKQRFGKDAKINIVSVVIVQVFKLSLGFLGFASSIALITSGILGTIITFTLAFIVFFKNDFKSLKINFSFLTKIVKKYKKYPLIDLWSGLLNSLSWQLPVILLGLFFSPIVVGYWVLSGTVVRIPLMMIGQSLGNVFFQKINEEKNKGNNPKELIKDVFELLVSFSFAPLLFLGILGEDIFKLFFGLNWSEAGVYTQILVFWIFFNFITSSLSSLFYTFDKVGLSFYVNIVVIVSRVIPLLIGGFYQDIYLTLVLYTISGGIVYGLVSIIILRFAEINYILYFKTIFLSFFRTLPFLLSILLLQYFFNNNIIVIVISIFILLLHLFFIVFSNNSLTRPFYLKLKGVKND